jgi:hypothetical protein
MSKGDNPRPYSVPLKQFDANYSRIFGDKKPNSQPPRKVAKSTANVTIVPDIEPFMSPSGEYITSRSKWREHLKRTNSIEISHSDVPYMQKVRAQKDRNIGKDPERKQRIIHEFNTRNLKRR